MKALYDVPAPAKLNLFLHITGRRPDGYHLLQSVFMLIDWCDTLHFELRTDGRISRADLGDFFMQSQAPVRHATGYDFQLRLLAEYKNLLEGIDLTTGDISIWKSQMKANLPQVFSVSQ